MRKKYYHRLLDAINHKHNSRTKKNTIVSTRQGRFLCIAGVFLTQDAQLWSSLLPVDALRCTFPVRSGAPGSSWISPYLDFHIYLVGLVEKSNIYLCFNGNTNIQNLDFTNEYFYSFSFSKSNNHQCYGSLTLTESDSEADTDSMKFYCHRVSVSPNTSNQPFTSRSRYRTRSWSV